MITCHANIYANQQKQDYKCIFCVVNNDNFGRFWKWEIISTYREIDEYQLCVHLKLKMKSPLTSYRRVFLESVGNSTNPPYQTYPYLRRLGCLYMTYMVDWIRNSVWMTWHMPRPALNAPGLPQFTVFSTPNTATASPKWQQYKTRV